MKAGAEESLTSPHPHPIVADCVHRCNESVLRNLVTALRAQIDCSGEPIGGRDAIWYGPHACDGCGMRIIKRDIHQGPELALDAPNNGPVYPSTRWELHACEGDLLLPRAAP